ncbi:SagB-type dehydrogenase family enzyme [Sedimentibacter acidaminivorans]|jgi:SagB-type dehydrogenase family enzyme|uniref:SagB-type dehydrogenase family enzyme n=1 Tax=Sedimentibacter acidaminivorans TaxID=913099 RepID=A0ABS4GBT0_9FIRM|nr:SagB/ThcOx family dehydrogenase [Sedimentibacter acidaminivorans]MBP1925151.1 SagB-type dehydrogenase family enzyme [Sedimentibacter acidaminivorans]
MENNQHIKNKIHSNREFMKSKFAEEGYESDQQKQLPQPPLTKAPIGNNSIKLTKEFSSLIKESDYLKLVQERKSQRVYKKESITLDQLSFLLWTTQGIKEIKGDNYATIRTVPSAGARHAFETYLAVLNVDGLEKGIYHYLPLDHSIELITEVDDIENKVSNSLCEQKFAAKSAVVFYYSAVAYRSEWRYVLESHKVMLIDAGHVMQNLYLSCGAIGCGTCAIAAFNQELADNLLKLNGKDEFVIYAAPIGNV